MQEMLTQETPGKVMGLLGATLFSMALLFSVSTSNASFTASEYALPDPFAPQKVVSLIDGVAASYSQALANFAEPAKNAIAIHAEGAKWVMAEASNSIVQDLGLSSLAQSQPASTQKVAGAFVVRGEYEPLSVDTLYGVLVGRRE